MPVRQDPAGRGLLRSRVKRAKQKNTRISRNGKPFPTFRFDKIFVFPKEARRRLKRHSEQDGSCEAGKAARREA